MIKRCWLYVRGLVLGTLGMLFVALPVYAETGYQLQQITTRDGEIAAYIRGDEMPIEIEYQIGMNPCDEVTFGSLEEMGEAIHTIFLVDNSLSITKDNRTKVLSIIKDYVQDLPTNEKVSLAIYGENIVFLQKESSDGNKLSEAVDTIEFNNQDTYLTDFLYELLDELKDRSEYTRIVIISDGVDNKEIGITKDELKDKIKDNLHPIYTIGQVVKSNQAELENLFALSRITNGSGFLLDQDTNVDEIITQLSDNKNLICIKAAIPSELHDGSEMNSQFTLHNGSGDFKVITNVKMPFSIKEPTPEPIPEPTPESTPEPTQKPEPTAEPTPEPVPEEPKSGGMDAGKVIALIVIVAAVVGLAISKKKKAGSNDSEDKANKVNKKAKNRKKEEAAPISAVLPEINEGESVADGRYLLVLRDLANPEKTFRYPMDTNVVVGRNVDKVKIVIDYSRTVSGQHCEFYRKGDRFFVRDMNSANHTYLNNVILSGDAEVASGSRIRLGEVEFIVEFIKI